MKKLVFLVTFIFITFVIEAQVKIPQASPKSTLTQVVGLTDVEIVYSRPSAKGRAVFGNLVPFGKLWRTGANENTTVSFSDDVKIDGKTLKKGKYALYTIPNIQSWEIIFYSSTDNWGVPRVFEESKVALRTKVAEEALALPVETFSIGINNIELGSASLEIAWENSSVSLRFEVPTNKTAIESIEKALAGPSAGDYFGAAQFYYSSNESIEKAREYVEKSIVLSKDVPFYYLRLKSLIQAKQGDRSGAIETAKLSLTGAEAAGNQDYVKMNKESIAEWSK